MTREEVKELLPIMQAYAKGKTIQHRGSIVDKWKDIDKPFFTERPSNYRVKPEPKYRPFRTKDECWNEMLKHEPFVLVKNKDAQYIKLLSVRDDKDLDNLFEIFTFIDGTPFGIKEE